MKRIKKIERSMKLTFDKVSRTGLTVWLKTLRQARQLHRHGYVYYVSRKMRYAILYVNTEEVDETIEALEKYPFILKIEKSHLDEIDMTFKNAIDNPIDPDKREERLKEDKDDFIESIARSLNKNKKKVRK